MNQLNEGLTLMLVGMTTVFTFLSLLVLVLVISSRVIQKYWPEKTHELSSESSLESSLESPPKNNNGHLIAVISAAIHRYRNSHKD